ncbi:MAG TPA: FAD-dependent oxidoreductase [Beijerinckiaceae bacterium]|nr:FAD-dependent oxidoreductase [Beijerinckiaceae bacterium]
MRERLVVIGNGMAGLRFLERLSQHAPARFDVTVVGGEPSPAYNRILLSSLLAAEVDEPACRFRDRPWYMRQGVRLITGAHASHLDVAEREVAVGTMTTLPYDRLVLATGSTPIRLPKPGMDLPGVVTFRSLCDVGAIRTAAQTGARAVVIGGGLLGLEAAYGLARLGVDTTLLHVMDRLMERQLDARAAALVKAAMERKGVRVELQADTAEVLGESRTEAVRLADGRVLPAELVVVAVGVRPAHELARDAGLEVGRGILVDDRLATSGAGIHAIGECAEHRGLAYGLVEPAYEQADILARRLAGHDAQYGGSVPATSLKVSGLPVFSAGLVGDDVEAEPLILTDRAAGTYRKLLVRDDRLVGALLVGDVAEGPWYLELIRSGERVGFFRQHLMFGRAFVPGAATVPDRKAA